MNPYGDLTPKAVGILLKEMVRRAIELIVSKQFTFEANAKITSYGIAPDVVTSVDKETQELYLHLVSTCLPHAGIIAEEDALRVECTDDRDLWVTIDPLDGTRAFIRGQSHGVGTMIALIQGDEVISAYVGDVMTREIYGYRPESKNVHRITQYNSGRALTIDTTRSLSDQWLLLATEPRHFSPFASQLFFDERRLFNSYEISSGSIGIAFSRLWKSEIGGVLLRPTTVTPWDVNPVIGISRKLGFVFCDLTDQQIKPREMKALRDFESFDAEWLVVHESRLEELTNFVKETEHQ